MPLHSAGRTALARAAAAVPLALLLIGLTSCNSDRTSAPLTKAGGIAASTEEFSLERPAPEEIPDISEEHGSHITVAQLSAALAAEPFAAAAITGLTHVNGHFQSALSNIVRGGMPTNGSDYLVVSAGDARNITLSAFPGGSCVFTPEFGHNLCGNGGINVTIAVPTSGNKLSFDFVYFANDYPPFLDPFQVFLVTGSGTTRIALATQTTDIINPPKAPGDTRLVFGPLRHVEIDLVPLRGQTITLLFRAANWADFSLPGGALVDNFVMEANTAPTVTLDAPASGDEGSAVTVTANVDDADGDALTVEWDFDGDGVADFTDVNVAAGSSTSHSWTYPDNGTATVTVTVTDPHGASASATADITINNVNPVITSLTVTGDPVQVGSPAALNATFTDAGTGDTHTASINWGDGTSSAGTVTEANGSGSVTGSHTYAEAGLYTVTLTVTDDDGGSDTRSVSYVIVVDPNAGFVTGGGWIGDKANYGFNAKYESGAATPSGNTTFQLEDGRKFKADSYDWLVVSGNRAWYQGSGTLDGVGGYKVLVAIIDGDQGPKPNGDRIRIQISNAGGIVFDTQAGPAGALPTTVPGGGNLQVHPN